jgi:hypothetical protein
VLERAGILIVKVFFITVNEFVCESRIDFYRLYKPLIQSSHMNDGNRCCFSGSRRSNVALTKYFYLFPSLWMSSGEPLHPLSANMLVSVRYKLSHANTVFNLYMTHTFMCNTEIHSKVVSHK